MFDSDIYKDMAARSGGEIYIGVVGPVRTGKPSWYCPTRTATGCKRWLTSFRNRRRAGRL